MTQEDKKLLLKDLCARLPYGVKFQGEDSNVYTLDAANYFAFQVEDMIFKPYLRPMSSMSEEEYQEFGYDVLRYTPREFDWLNAHHFDYRGMIEKGLALEASADMYKTE